MFVNHLHTRHIQTKLLLLVLNPRLVGKNHIQERLLNYAPVKRAAKAPFQRAFRIREDSLFFQVAV